MGLVRRPVGLVCADVYKRRNYVISSLVHPIRFFYQISFFDGPNVCTDCAVQMAPSVMQHNHYEN